MLLPLAGQGQTLTVSLSATNNAPDKCSARTISASASGGSGGYSYYWSSYPTSTVNLGNGPSITVSPTVATTYTVAVWDNTAGLYAEKSITVCPLLTGSFSQFIQNSFMEGEIWKVLNASGGTGPLNAYRYELRFINDWGSQVYSASQTISSGLQGLMGG
ncbi:hypothetical protein, partial [Cesiribacter andamanensis]|uniref:hypothetical protein n=1 Tax=Cesiribacter andamanensis TaxID=649507 RepID=UPI001267F28C